jgi:hypothetical protein
MMYSFNKKLLIDIDPEVLQIRTIEDRKMLAVDCAFRALRSIPIAQLPSDDRSTNSAAG